LPKQDEATAAAQFIATQPDNYLGQADAQTRTWRDFCQMLLASSAFLYVE
jgi:hypothetical protein